MCSIAKRVKHINATNQGNPNTVQLKSTNCGYANQNEVSIIGLAQQKIQHILRHSLESENLLMHEQAKKNRCSCSATLL